MAFRSCAGFYLKGINMLIYSGSDSEEDLK